MAVGNSPDGPRRIAHGTTKARIVRAFAVLACRREGGLEPVDLAELVPGGPKDVGLSVEAPLLRPGLPHAVGAAGGGGVPRNAVHACTSCALSAGAGARVIRISPLTVLTRISMVGRSAMGSPDMSRSELVSPLRVLQSR